MRDTISSGIGSLLSVMASHVRRAITFGADAPYHLSPRIHTGVRTDSGEDREIRSGARQREGPGPPGAPWAGACWRGTHALEVVEAALLRACRQGKTLKIG